MEKKQFKFISLLLQAGASCSIKDSEEMTPLHYAKDSQCVEAFVKASDEETRGDSERAHVLNITNKEGMTPLMLRIKTLDKDVPEDVQLMVDNEF